MTPVKKGNLLIHTAVMLFGFSGLFAKFISASSEVIVSGRVFFAAVTLYFITYKARKSISIRTDLTKLILLGFLLGFHWFTFFQSIKLSSVGVGLISFSTFPAFVLLYQKIFTGYIFRKTDILTIVIILLGVLLIIPDYNFGNEIFSGMLVGLFSAISFAILTVMNQSLVSKYNGLILSYYQYIFAFVFMLPVVFFSELKLSHNDILLLILLGVIFTAFGHSIFIQSLKFIDAKKASIITCLEPVYGIVFALFILDEIPELRSVLGGVLIIGAIVFVTLKKD